MKNKEELISKIMEMTDLSNDEKAEIIGSLRKTKKFGLVWENHKEDVEEQLRDNLPILKEDKEAAILSPSGESEGGCPNHVLIEGDNLAALSALAYTHAGMVDVIYIDPPYNTGNKDFVYNDSFVDSEDGYRHSKWLSFMEKRLRIAKKLLSDKGVIFISIDDNEQAHFKLLCDEVFGYNYVGEIIWETATDNNPTQISIDHEYVLCYSKDKANLEKWGITSEKALLINKKYTEIKKSGVTDLIEIRKQLKAWIKSMKKSNEVDLSGVSHYDYVDEKGVFYPGNSANTKPGDYTYDIVHPVTGKVCAKPANGYRWPASTFWDADARGDVLWGPDETTIPKIKKRIETATELLKSYYYEDGRAASKALEDILGSKAFNNPKPIRLVSKLIKFSSESKSLILDFFAGSGTTLHATMQLNTEDGGHRQCILVTNNENNICREVTYERNKRVIQGYTTPNGVEVEGLKDNNLRYYTTEFLPRETSFDAKQALMRAAADMVCIKENIYTEEREFMGMKWKPSLLRYFREKDGRQMLFVFDERVIEHIVPLMREMDGTIKVYAFSNGPYAYEDEFEELRDKVDLCALPEAILNVYNKVLPPKEEEAVI